MIVYDLDDFNIFLSVLKHDSRIVSHYVTFHHKV